SLSLRHPAPQVRASPEVGFDGVGSGRERVLESIYSLLNKSLLVRIEANETVGSVGGYISEGPRFTMLETIREYARERLATEGGDPTRTGRQGESDTLARAHALYLMQLAEEAEPHLSGPDQVAWLDRLEVEHDNLR